MRAVAEANPAMTAEAAARRDDGAKGGRLRDEMKDGRWRRRLRDEMQAVDMAGWPAPR